MIKIGIDLSLNSTAVCTQAPTHTTIRSYTTQPSNYKWCKLLSGIENVQIVQIPSILAPSSDYSIKEIYKLELFNELSTIIVAEIWNETHGSTDNTVNIEGYSYSSNTNAILDIVTFSTLVRHKIRQMVECKMQIFSPASVKKNTAIGVYGYQNAPVGVSGKPLKKEPIATNHEGVVGGKFTKHEMYKALLDSQFQHPIMKFLRDNAAEILALKHIPSPISDIVDAILISEL